MKLKLPRSAAWRALAAAIASGLMLSACGGGGGGTAPAAPVADPNPIVKPPVPDANAPTLDQIKQFLAAADQRDATAPVTGAQLTSFDDACYLNNGQTKAIRADNWDANAPSPRSGSDFAWGVQRSNITVLAERNSTNADGSARKEADVRFDVAYPDGTTIPGARTTLVFGSSSGSCATPESQTYWRVLGNRRVVQIGVESRNLMNDNFNLSDGADQGSNRRRDIRFTVRDWGKTNVATYAIITGPGPAAANGAPFSLKLLSPRIMRDAPEMKNKVGNANWRDIDSFRICGISTAGVPDAARADCTGAGANLFGGDNVGVTQNLGVGAPANSLADGTFTAQGWQAGGTYTFAVYNDDGWKAVNGQATKTPIATYTAVLTALPFTFAELDTTPASYPDIFTSTVAPAQIAQSMKGAGGTTTLGWTAPVPPAGAKVFALDGLFPFAQGTVAGATGSWPRVRNSTQVYPGSKATSAAVPILGQPAGTSATTSGNVSLDYIDRNGRRMIQNLNFQ